MNMANMVFGIHREPTDILPRENNNRQWATTHNKEYYDRRIEYGSSWRNGGHTSRYDRMHTQEPRENENENREILLIKVQITVLGNVHCHNVSYIIYTKMCAGASLSSNFRPFTHKYGSRAFLISDFARAIIVEVMMRFRATVNLVRAKLGHENQITKISSLPTIFYFLGSLGNFHIFPSSSLVRL